MPRLTADRILALIVFSGACAALFIWIPLDVDGGYVDRVRRKYVIGDALAPTFAMAIAALSGLALLIQKPKCDRHALDARSLRWVAMVGSVLAAALFLMRFSGPFFVDLLNADDYRLLRDTVPWKYIGFFLGGTTLVAGLIGIVERRFSIRRLGLAMIAVLVMMMLYDLPFEDLLLPPNGDV